MRIRYEKSKDSKPMFWFDVDIGQAAELTTERGGDTYLKVAANVGLLLTEQYEVTLAEVKTKTVPDCPVRAIFDVELTLTRKKK